MTVQTKKKKQSKKKINKKPVRNEMYERIGFVFVIFGCILSAFKLGLIGQWLSNAFGFIFGYLAYLVYIALCGLAVYVIYQGKYPRWLGPKAVGGYLVFVSLMIIFAAPQDATLKGFSCVNQFLRHPLETGSGFVGAIFFSILSLLFDRLGTFIFAYLLMFVGAALIIGKTYFELAKKNINEKHRELKAQRQQRKQIEEETVKNVNSPKKKQTLFYPDKMFEEPEEKVEIIKAEPRSYIESEVPKVSNEREKEEEPKLSTKNKNSSEYVLPPLSILKSNSFNHDNLLENNKLAKDNAYKLTKVLKEFNVGASVSNIYIGPAVTKYELVLETGTRVNRISSLQDDIKLALAAKDIRIEAPIPGKSAVGVEIPNKQASMVGFKEVFADIPKKHASSKLLVPLGKDVMGTSVFAELNKMPHLLIAGATGSGKSVCVNGIICSLLMRTKPEEVKLMLVDPKKVELSIYNGVPHLISPVITDPKKAAKALHIVVDEMERRYDLFSENNVRNIDGYNQWATHHNKKNPDQSKEILPYIVVILDEVADLMMVASKDVEDCIMRISQMARAAGIHLIVATQRPSTDVITGVIKANIPSRIAFAVSSSIDSRTILDMAGAEKLLGKGDMLFSPMGSSAPVRVQGSFVSDEEVEAIVDYCKQQQEADFDEQFIDLDNQSDDYMNDDDVDEEYEQCRDFVIQQQKASTSLLQRRFKIGYNKAARIIDQLEANGIIGPANGSKQREVFVRRYEEEEL